MVYSSSLLSENWKFQVNLSLCSNFVSVLNEFLLAPC
ncbi:hypothetical protein SLEP1_g44962 [Rubroshorea leprosula]|uniref:Uncharacterized protein n=1 Tax=Rubroshorea leprosula TaxID=152421 RepID=A0AAV5LHP0_9ROSI|nr:hypothetical protein SLEP1_g44962 [Rubroshorea leprosula]